MPEVRGVVCDTPRPMEKLSVREARRIAVAAQGFAQARPRGRVSMRHLRDVLNRVHLVQIDSVNVLARSHYLPFFSRLGPYDPALLDSAAYTSGEVFEYWAHAACIVPMEQFALFRQRMAGWSGHGAEALQTEHPGYLDAILAEVEARGPLSAGELGDGGARSGPWWGYGKGKTALEVHFGRGTLTTRARRNFSRVYDLTARALPAHAFAQAALSKEDADREMLRRAARASGVATLSDLADYYRLRQQEARPRVAELMDSGELLPVTVEGWGQQAFLYREAAIPARVRACALLTPFDSLVWTRDRAERLFDFHYRIEIYTPGPKRTFGYYVMPFLLGETIAARVDLKAERTTGTLAVRAAYLEAGAKAMHVAPALAEELRSMATWLGLSRIEVAERGDLAPPLRNALGG